MLQILILLSHAGIVSFLHMPQGALAHARANDGYVGESEEEALESLTSTAKQSALVSSSLCFKALKEDYCKDGDAIMYNAVRTLENNDGWRFE